MTIRCYASGSSGTGGISSNLRISSAAEFGRSKSDVPTFVYHKLGRALKGVSTSCLTPIDLKKKPQNDPEK